MPNPRDPLSADAPKPIGPAAVSGQVENVEVTRKISQHGNVKTTTEHILGEFVMPDHGEQQARHHSTYDQLGQGVFDVGRPSVSCALDLGRSSAEQQRAQHEAVYSALGITIQNDALPGRMVAIWRPDGGNAGGRAAALDDELWLRFIVLLSDAVNRGGTEAGRKARRELAKLIGGLSAEELTALMTHLFFTAAFFPMSEDAEELATLLRKSRWLIFWISFMMAAHLGEPIGGDKEQLEFWGALLQYVHVLETFVRFLPEKSKKKIRALIQRRLEALAGMINYAKRSMVRGGPEPSPPLATGRPSSMKPSVSKQL